MKWMAGVTEARIIVHYSYCFKLNRISMRIVAENAKKVMMRYTLRRKQNNKSKTITECLMCTLITCTIYKSFRMKMALFEN